MSVKDLIKGKRHMSVDYNNTHSCHCKRCELINSKADVVIVVRFV